MLFLDCDTLVKADVTPAFVARAIAMAAEIWPAPAACFSGQPDFAVTQAAGLDSAPFWNSGVVAIANDAAGKALVAAWHAEWVGFPAGWDEMAMLRALKSQNVTPATLDAKYNDQTLPPKECRRGDRALGGRHEAAGRVPGRTLIPDTWHLAPDT